MQWKLVKTFTPDQKYRLMVHSLSVCVMVELRLLFEIRVELDELSVQCKVNSSYKHRHELVTVPSRMLIDHPAMALYIAVCCRFHPKLIPIGIDSIFHPLQVLTSTAFHHNFVSVIRILILHSLSPMILSLSHEQRQEFLTQANSHIRHKFKVAYTNMVNDSIHVLCNDT